ncbi:MAG TPA: hypothetical protein DGL25_00685 [Dehalococcoidia bacterium]|nr:hypothetical protein [Dehalococcoidia bacterium]|tara:strand:- start:20720 stop:21607 length:888 start_codon:yes stop_codon:yes gene_type:complete
MTGLWYEITAETPPALVEVVSAIMRDSAPGGLAIEEPVDLLGPEEGYEVRIDEPVALRIYLPASELGAVLTQRLREDLEDFTDVELTARPIYEKDWAVSWREFFGPVIAGRLAIVPSWVEFEPKPDQLIVQLDPGQAFGTGHHETTRLCLAALDEAVSPGAHICDVGTGSGILSIAAVVLGAGRVDAFEIDPIAADVARANCEANNTGNRVTVRGSFPTESVPKCDLTIVNVSARADIDLAGPLAASLKTGGRLIASGFLIGDRDEVVAAFTQQGLRLTGERQEHEWTLIELVAN